MLKERFIVAEDLGSEYNIEVEFTPTVPHCSLASMIALCIVEKLRRELQKPFKVRQAIYFWHHPDQVDRSVEFIDKLNINDITMIARY